MAEETPPDLGFTIVDRRRRGEEPSESPAEPARDEATVRAVTGRSPRPSAEPARTAAPRAEALPAPDLASFILMLYSQALVHLGEAPDPFTQKLDRDLAQAKYTIDLLDLLKAKTEGNRTPEESQVLEEALHALRVGYLQAVRVL